MMDIVENQMPSLKQTNPAILTSLSTVPAIDLEVGPMIVEEVESKIESLENQIKQKQEKLNKRKF